MTLISLAAGRLVVMRWAEEERSSMYTLKRVPAVTVVLAGVINV